MKTDRHKKIIDLIQHENIDTQKELARRLNEAGFNVTQATVSRDIRALQLMKTADSAGVSHYAIPQREDMILGEKYIRVLRDGFISMDMAQNLLVIKTVSGMAMAVCAAIDAMDWKEVVGSIAGDDTIMCAVRSIEETRQLMEKITKIVKNKNKT